MIDSKVNNNGSRGIGADVQRVISPLVLTEVLTGALALLWRGFEYARDLESDVWDFAVECDDLYEVGISAIDLRWLIRRGYVDFSVPTDRHSDCVNDVPNANEIWTVKGTRFVLTNAGAVLAREIHRGGFQTFRSTQREPGNSGRDSEHLDRAAIIDLRRSGERPAWDRDRKELRFGRWVIKQFKWSAPNQEAILMTFEEEGWPARIDDPLPPKPNQDSKHRLHDTIKCLNQNHKKRMIRFSGDGTGEGILWTFLDDADIKSVTDSSLNSAR